MGPEMSTTSVPVAREESALSRRVRFAGLLLGPVAAFAMAFVVPIAPDSPAASRVAAVGTWMAIWWICEAIPLGATALLPVVVLPLLGIMGPGAVASQYFNDTIFLFIGGFLVALSMERSGLHRRIALAILSKVGARPAALLLGFLVATAFLSMWISNTATAMMMTPIALALILRLEEAGGRQARRFTVGALLAIAYGASIGGVATLVGTPPNLALRSIHENLFPENDPLTFGSWLFFGLPLSVVLLGACWGVLSLFFTRGTVLMSEGEAIRRQRAAQGPMDQAQGTTLVLFISLAVLWITRAPLDLGSFAFPGWAGIFPEPSYVSDGVVAVGIGLLLFILPNGRAPGERLLGVKALRDLPWGIVLLFGGGFALAGAFRESGLSDWVAGQSGALQGLPPLLVIMALCLMATFLTELTSNTATANILLPILGANAQAMDLHPLLLMIPGALSCSMAFMLPVATPPNAIVFASDRLRVSQMAGVGLVMNLIGVVVISLFSWYLAGPILGLN